MRYPDVNIKVPLTFGGGSAITFASLFQTSDDAHYKLTDTSTLWQVSDGTTAVTADAQPIGRISDISGNGNHATQAVNAERALLGSRLGLHVLEPDYVDDSYDLPMNNVVGVFWFASQFGAQVLDMTAFGKLPMGQYFECGFFGRALSAEETVVLQTYADSLISGGPILEDGELIEDSYSVNDAFSGKIAPGFRFSSDNSYLSANSPFNGIPAADFNGTTTVTNDKYTLEAAVAANVEGIFIDSWATSPYRSTGIYKESTLSPFYNTTNFESWAMYFGSAAAISSISPNNFFINATHNAGPHKGYGLCGALPDLSHVTGITAYIANGQSFSGQISEYAKPANMSSGLISYSVSDNFLSGNIPPISNINPATAAYIYFNGNLFTGYEGGGVNPALTEFGDFDATVNSLTQAAVDLILSDFADTIGTITSGPRTINLDGGSNSTPSAAGVVNKNLLVAAGWTVITN